MESINSVCFKELLSLASVEFEFSSQFVGSEDGIAGFVEWLKSVSKFTIASDEDQICPAHVRTPIWNNRDEALPDFSLLREPHFHNMPCCHATQTEVHSILVEVNEEYFH